MSEKTTFSTLIGNAYKTWEDEVIVLDGGTGTGKTYFVLDVLACYLQSIGEQMLYLCNRSALREEVSGKVEERCLSSTVKVMTYQALEQKIIRKEEIPYYKYIIADECHYFTNDALFNDYTDESYIYLKEMKGVVKIYLSATAKVYFHWLKKSGSVKDKNYYSIPKDYSYVEKVYFYSKDQLFPLIDNILETEQDSKIMVFCNAIQRMEELWEKYGTQAVYVASKNALRVRWICGDNVIYDHENGIITFDKRLLITTKVLDNGINVKDPKVKHIFSEMLDADSTIQALGRKRSLEKEDTCTFYIKEYNRQAIQCFINQYNYQIEPVMAYWKDYPLFMERYAYNKKRIRHNQIFQVHFEDKKEDAKLSFNKMRLKKYIMDKEIFEEMKQKGYCCVMLQMFGAELQKKAKNLKAIILDNARKSEYEEILEYLHSIEGQKLFSKDREALKLQLKKIAFNFKGAGINTLNGVLEDIFGDKYPCRLRNKKLDENGNLTKNNLIDKTRKTPQGQPNLNRDKAYWILD